MNPDLDIWAAAIIEKRDADGLLRSAQEMTGVGGILRHEGRTLINLSSNDYLNLAGDARVRKGAKAAIDTWGAGAGASRLICGGLACHRELECELAAYKSTEDALLFGSGYLANLGVADALIETRDEVLMDRLAHASLIDGVRRQGCRFKRYRHNDMEHLESLLKARSGTGRTWIVTESVFSMDGDIAPIEDIAHLCTQYDAYWILDEAHAVGVFGPGLASGLAPAQRPDIIVGTLSKGLGAYGGYVCCSAQLRTVLVNLARSVIYTTALPPAVIGAATSALRIVRVDPDMGPALLASAAQFREQLVAGGLDTGPSATQIVPVLVGEPDRAMSLAHALHEDGIIAVAIRPPTVPEGSSRLRLSLSSAHTPEHLERAAESLIRHASESP